LRPQRAALLSLGGLLLCGCGSPVGAAGRPAAYAVARAALPSPTLEGLLSRPPDLVLTVHPRAFARDPVYGPLLRRASELASAYAGPTNLGTTALAVLERTDEIVVAENDRGSEAVVVLRGVPAELDPLDVVDPTGRRLWTPVRGDIRAASRELSPVDAADAALFVAPGLTWVVASGPAIAKARAALLGDVGAQAFAGDDTALVSLSIPGGALPQLRQGALAPVGTRLRTIRFELTPGSSGLIVGKLSYEDELAAASAEGTVLAATLAFRHRLEEDVAAADVAPRLPGGGRPPRRATNLDWLGAAKVEREGVVVSVRAPIPRPWLDVLARAELPAPPL